MGRPLHDYLEEFPFRGGPERTAVAARFQDRPNIRVTHRAASQVDVQIGEAYAAGVDAGQRLGRAQFEEQIAALRGDFDRQLDTLEGSHAQSLAETIVCAITEQLDDLRRHLVERMTAAVLPVLRHALIEAAVRELVAELDDLIGDGETVTVEISGPADLVRRITESYLAHGSGSKGRPGPELTTRTGSTSEVRITVDDTVVETRLFEWIGRAMEAVG